MNALQVLVVDDEQLARARLIRMLERAGGVTVIGEAEDGAAALALIKAQPPDVVFLDVDMPGLDGLAVAEAATGVAIVFTTAHVEHAADAFDLDAVDYLLKPVRQDRLERALERLRRRQPEAATATAGERIAVHGPGTVRFVDAARVNLFRALDKYTEFTVDGEQLLVRESLDALEERLAPSGFVRVHRAALVRAAAVQELAQEPDGELRVHLVDGTRAAVSRRAAPELRRLLLRR